MIEGSLRNVPLADIFQVIATGQKSGVLTVQRGAARARIYFDRGRIGYAHVTPGVHLGEILVHMDLLTAHEVQELLRRQHTEMPGTQLGEMAVRLGLLDQEDLNRAIDRQALEVVSDLLTWSEGRFYFTDTPTEATQPPLEHTVDAMSLLLEVVARQEQFASTDVGPDAVFMRAGDPTRVDMPPGGWEVLASVDGRRSARTIAAELDLTERHVYHLLGELERLGVIERSPIAANDPTVLVVSPNVALQRLLRLGLQRAGFTAVPAYRYEDTEPALGEHRPSAVVVDDDRLGSGWEVVRAMRRRPAHAHLPVLVLVDEPPKPGLFRRLPRAETLLKPFHELRLQELVSRMVGRKAT